MTPKRMFPLDRSAMFTILLDVDPGFPGLEADVGRVRVTAALAAWYADDGLDMYHFARDWSAAHPLTLET